MSEGQTPVLVIDDEEVVRGVLAASLRRLGYECREAADGVAGLEELRRSLPALVLCDLRMPRMDGLELLAVVREEFPQLPVIVMSGAGVFGDAVNALKLGAWDYVTKPLPELAALEHAVAKALEKAALLGENRRYREHLEAANTVLAASLRQLADDETPSPGWGCASSPRCPTTSPSSSSSAEDVMPRPARAAYGRTDRLSVLGLEGEVRYLVARPLRAFIDEIAAHDGNDTLVIDLRDLDLIDSTGLGLIARLGRRMLEAHGRRAIIVAPRSDVATVLRAAAFDVVFDMLDHPPFELDVPLAPIPLDEPFDKDDGGPVILEAHRDLARMDERNRAAFGPVIEALAAQLAQKERTAK